MSNKLTPAELEEVDRNVAITRAAVDLAKNMPITDPLNGTTPKLSDIINIGYCALIRANNTMRGLDPEDEVSQRLREAGR